VGNNVKNNLYIELQNDEVLKNCFLEATSLSQFYSCLAISTFLEIKHFAQKLIRHLQVHICEQTFFVAKKKKHSSRLSDKHIHSVLRVSTTSLQADIEKVINCSHRNRINLQI
jgi:hypothetical protein